MEGSAVRNMMLWQRVLLPSLKNLDKVIAGLGVPASILLIIASSFLSGYIVYPIVFGMVLVSCLMYLAASKDFQLHSDFLGSGVNIKIWTIFFFLLYTLSLLVLYLRPNLYERPLIYFLLIVLMSGVIACGCLNAGRQHVWLILIQIILLGVNIGWSQLLIVPSLIGIDPWYHYGLTSRILEGHYIPEEYGYSKLPIFHLVIAATSIITTFPYKFATMISVSFGQIACNAIFVFLIAKCLLKNHRIGLLAALLVITAGQHIQWSYWSIPNALGGVFILITTYLLLTKYNSPSRFETTVLMILLMSTIILTHTLVAACMAIFLFVIYGSFSYRQFIISGGFNSYISLLVPVLFSLTMFTWWIYGATTVYEFAQFIANDFSLDYMLYSMDLKSTIVIPTSEVVLPALGKYLFLCPAIVGILYMLSTKGNRSMFSLAMVSLVLILLPFLFYITGRSLFEYRWNYFAQVFLSIPLALTLYLLGTCKIKRNLIANCFVCGTVVLLSFLMIMNPSTCDDNHTFAPTTGRTNYYTQSEMTGSEFFAKKTTSVLSSDMNYAFNPSSSIFKHVYDIDYDRLHNLDFSINSGEFDHDGSVKIFRLSHILEFQRKGFLAPNLQPPIYISNMGFSKIYDNFAMSGYIG